MRMLIGMVLFALLLVVLGFAGEDERRTDMEYAPVRAQIYASAPGWAVRE